MNKDQDLAGEAGESITSSFCSLRRRGRGQGASSMGTLRTLLSSGGLPRNEGLSSPLRKTEGDRMARLGTGHCPTWGAE